VVKIKLAMMFTCGYALIVVIFAASIVRGFSRDHGVLAIAELAVRLFHLGLPLFALQSLTMALLQAKGEALLASLLAAARQGLFMVPLMIILRCFYGIDGIISSQLLADAIVGSLAWIVLMHQLNHLRLLAPNAKTTNIAL